MKPVAVFRFQSTKDPGQFATFLEANGIPWTLVSLNLDEPVPESSEAFSGLAFMGGAISANANVPWSASVLRLMRDAVLREVPVIGHCLGGQLLSRALGGQVTPSPLKEIGWNLVHAEDTPLARLWFGIELTEFAAFHWHDETFSIPPGGERILYGPYCENQAYVVENRHLGMQCHVEMTAEMIAVWCDLELDDIEANLASPCVMSIERIKAEMPDRLRTLRVVAERLYSRWICNLRA